MPGPLFSADDWFTTKEFLKKVAAGRKPDECMPEIRYELYKKFNNSAIFAIRNFFYTADKQRELTLLDPWPGQAVLQICYESQRSIGFPVRVVEDKPRQVGWTGWDLALGFHASLHPRTKVGVLVNDVDVAEDLSLRVNTMYNSLPRWMRPMKRIDNPSKLIFDNPNHRERDERPGLNSQIHITVPQSLRGFTPHFFIWSEAAFCKQWREVVDGVMGGIATNKHSAIFVDTTPNGDDPFYKPMLYEAIERNPKWVASWERYGAPTRDEIVQGILGQPDRPKDGFVPAYSPWHWHPEYDCENSSPYAHLGRIEDEDVQHLVATLGTEDKFGGEEEIELRDRFGVTPYKLFWRRWKIANDTAGEDEHERLMRFRAEYSYKWDSGFSKLGRGAFDMKGLEKLSRWIGPGSRYGPRPPAARGLLRREENGRIYVDQTWHSKHLEVRVWAPPDPGEHYTMFVDTAWAYMSTDADATVACVLRKRDNKQVAVMEARVSPDVYEDQVFFLYHWYNKCYWSPEMENDGYSLAHRLFQRGCQNMFYYKRYDRDTTEPAKDLGWETNRKTRPILQNALVRAIGARDKHGHASPEVIVCDEKTMQEILDATRDREGFIEVEHGHDDHMIAFMGALALAEDPWGGIYQPPKPEVEERELNALVKKMGLNFGEDRSRPKYELL